GSAKVNVVTMTGTTPFTYSWNPGGLNTQNISGLNAGIYTVTVTDNAGCIGTATVNIASSASPTFNIIGTHITCTQSGNAYVSNVSGAAPYTYLWSTGQPSSNISCPVSGIYTVTVTDAGGCTGTSTVNITGTSPASATFTYPSPICVGQKITFVNTGTTGTYSWNISAPASVSGTSPDFSYTFLTAGTYSVFHSVVTAGCSNIVLYLIQVINCATGPAVTATGSSVCPGSCATVTSTGAGGTSPYTYSWSNGSTTQNINPCPVTTTTYTVTIRDAGGTTATTTATVNVNPAVSVTVTSTNITCNGGTNGSATATGNSGTTPFTYNWSNVVPGSGFQVSGLSAGTYLVTVTDNKGCTGSSSVTIAAPPSLSGQFTKGTANCAGCGCKEWLMVTANGGTSPYSYSWPDGYVNRYKNQLCPGSYLINIKDKNGCSVNVNLSTP
ncbi:MAG: hypothetical protein HYU69_02700, partial [Bacteroidetes bacterium]|nr:hypothetical protein [Bacteroidota bacterium]